MKNKHVYLVIEFDDESYPWVHGVYNTVRFAHNQEVKLWRRHRVSVASTTLLKMRLKGDPLEDTKHCYIYIQNNRIQSVHKTYEGAYTSSMRFPMRKLAKWDDKGFIIKKRIRG